MSTFKGKPEQARKLIDEGVESFIQLAAAGHPAELDIGLVLNFGLDRESALKLGGSVAEGALAALAAVPGVEATASHENATQLNAGGGIVVRLKATAEARTVESQKRLSDG